MIYARNIGLQSRCMGDERQKMAHYLFTRTIAFHGLSYLEDNCQQTLLRLQISTRLFRLESSRFPRAQLFRNHSSRERWVYEAKTYFDTVCPRSTSSCLGFLTWSGSTICWEGKKDIQPSLRTIIDLVKQQLAHLPLNPHCYWNQTILLFVT